MLCSRKTNHRISKLHDRAIRIEYNDCETSFSDFLGSFSVHNTKVQSLLIELTQSSIIYL